MPLRSSSRPSTSTTSSSASRCCWSGSRRRLPTSSACRRSKAPDTRFPLREIEAAGYGARWVGQPSWNGVAILAKGMTPVETRRQLPGDPSDTQSRYLEAAVHGVLVGCLYAPNGNPRSRARKVRVQARVDASPPRPCTGTLPRDRSHPVALVGELQRGCPPTSTSTTPDRGPRTHSCSQSPAPSISGLLAQGWTDAIKATHPGEAALHLLGLPSTGMGKKRGHAPRSHPLERRSRTRLARNRSRRVGAGRAGRQRSSAAPTWANLETNLPS